MKEKTLNISELDQYLGCNNRIAPNHFGIEVLSHNGLLLTAPLIQILHLQHVPGTENCVIDTVAPVGRKY